MSGILIYSIGFLFPGLYNLFAALAEVVNAEIAPVLGKIVERMLDSVKSSDDILPEFEKEDNVAEIGGHDENDESDDIDIENSDDEDDDDEDDYAGWCSEHICFCLLYGLRV